MASSEYPSSPELAMIAAENAAPPQSEMHAETQCAVEAEAVAEALPAADSKIPVKKSRRVAEHESKRGRKVLGLMQEG